jgi:hypothetical protein
MQQPCRGGWLEVQPCWSVEVDWFDEVKCQAVEQVWLAIGQEALAVPGAGRWTPSILIDLIALGAAGDV